jgi:hypothetical protein
MKSCHSRCRCSRCRGLRPFKPTSDFLGDIGQNDREV